MFDGILPRQVDNPYCGHKLALWLFGAAGAQAFVSIFAAWGLAQATIGVPSIVVLVRYRALVPFICALLLLEHLCRKAIFAVMPIDRTADAPAHFINLVLVGLMVAGLVLSLRNPGNRRVPS